MAARIDSLDISLFTLDVGNAGAAQNLLARLTGYELGLPQTVANTKGIAQRHQRGKVTAVEETFRVSLNQEDGSNVVQTALDISALTIGGSAYVTQARSTKLAIRTLVDEGKAYNSMKKWSNATGTDYSLDAELMVSAAAAHALETAAESSTATDKELTTTWTFGGLTITAPMVLSSLNRTGESERIQMLSVSLQGNGAPTSPSGTGTGFVEILWRMLLGTAEFAAIIHPAGTTSGARLISSHASRKALMLELNIDGNEEEVLRWEGTLQMTGGGIGGNQS